MQFIPPGNAPMNLHPVHSIPGVWRIRSATNGYLVVRDGDALLVDCPSDAKDEIRDALRSAGLPSPSIVLHTQVQAEHCGEWAAFPDARVHVSQDWLDVAILSERFYTDCKTWWPPDRVWEARGEDKYGVGGCVTERPPEQPLSIGGALPVGKPFQWRGESFEVVPLPGSGKRAIGLLWRQQNVLFSGDLVRRGGYLVNLYDLERAYGLLHGYAQLRDSLRRVLALSPRLLLPTTGDVIDDAQGDASRLLERIAWVLSPPSCRADQPAGVLNYTPVREFGRYRQIVDGLYQNNNYGAVVLFVDDQGRGLMVDPDNCVWRSWEENCREFHADLDLLERETGLKTVEYALLTHYHGDHFEYAPLLRERYGTQILATPDVATLVERPWDFPYPCVLPWFDFPYDHLKIDRRIAYDRTFEWHGTPVTPTRTAGHCWAHAGYLIQWRGLRVMCTGDSLQYVSGPICGALPVIYNDTAWPDRGFARHYAKVAALRPDLVLGGHSQSFFDRDGAILRDLVDVALETQALAQAMVGDADLRTAMTPPGYDEARPEGE